MIQFTVTKELQNALHANGVEVSQYKPAYDGESVGLDLYNAGPDITVPSYLADFGTKVPSGLKIALPPYFTGLILQRGSVMKTPLIHRAGVIDPGWTAETMINVVNLSHEDYIIKEYQKLPFQIVAMPCITQYCYIDEDTFNTTTRHAKRKDACIGSSDKSIPVPTDRLTTLEYPIKAVIFAHENKQYANIMDCL